MKLIDLEANFIRYTKGIADSSHGRKQEDGSVKWGGFEITIMQVVESFQEAQGIMFLCPLCFKNNNGSNGTHSVEVTFEGRGVSNEDGSHNKEGKPTRWNIIGGSGLNDLQLSPSILLESGCQWHGFIGHNGIPAGEAQ